MTAKLTNIGKNSLHSTLNKRLRLLEKKGYVKREDRKWFLKYKGIIANLLIQPKQKIWNPIWKDIFEQKMKILEKFSEKVLDEDQRKDVHEGLKYSSFLLDDFNAWINYSTLVKNLSKNGIINLDLIRDETLLSILISETLFLEEFSTITRPG